MRSGDVEAVSFLSREVREKSLMHLTRLRAPRDLTREQTVLDNQLGPPPRGAGTLNVPPPPRTDLK
eukprot:9374462-Alexandrium_andersonii.AAC.1